MRIAIAALVLIGVASLAATPAKTAPVPLAGPAAQTLSGAADPLVVTVAKRSRKTVSRAVRKCGWQCKPYWRPYQYHYWQFYYPHGGPFFYGKR